jgi:methylisocitrate lyase
MSWLTTAPRPPADLRQEFRDLLHDPQILMAPGAHDALTGLLAKRAGFRALYLSGGAESARRGFPDVELLTSADLAHAARDLVRATQLPVLVDIDTGFGGVLTVVRTARELAEVGAAAVQIEDQASPKRCGHLAGKRVVPTGEMTARIQAVREAVPDLVVVARSDARAVEGLDGMVARVREYVAAGADCIFPEALTSEAEFGAVRDAVDAPLLVNMTEFGQSPLLSAEELEKLGYQVVIYPVSSLRIAAHAVQRLMETIRREGTTRGLLESMQSRQDLYATIAYPEYEILEDRLLR